MKSITFDQKSISAISAGQLSMDSFYADLDLPISDEMTKCVTVGSHAYVLSRAFEPTDALMTVLLTADVPLVDLAPTVRKETLVRLMRCATMLVTGRLRSIPKSWRPWHQNNLLAFQADRRVRPEEGGRTNAGRIVLDLSRESGPVYFAFKLDLVGSRNLGGLIPAKDIQRTALDGVVKALRHTELH